MPRKETKGRNANGLGTIRKKTVTRNGKAYTYWEGRCTVGYDMGTGKQIQKSITGRTQKEVAQKIRQLSVEVDNKTYIEPCKMTVREWLEVWLNEYVKDVKPSTHFIYECYAVSYINPYIGAVKLSSLTAPIVQKLYNTLSDTGLKDKKPLSPKTVKCLHSVLHSAMKKAVEVGYLHFNPTDACSIPKVIKKEIKPLEEAQLSAFLAAIEGHPHELFYKVAVFTGAREGELLGATWDCVDLENGVLLINKQLTRERQKGGGYHLSPTKNGKSRTLTLAPSVVQLLRRQRFKETEKKAQAGEAWEEDNLVFSNPVGGFLSYRTVYDCYKRVVDKLGFPNARVHDLRHTYATLSLKMGDDIKTVQENLGHATASFTLDQYGHVTEKMKKDSANRMEKMIQEISSISGQ